MIRLLIVDDEKTIRNGLTFAVPWNEHGYIVVYTAKNGIDALHFMKTHYADIIISDIKMPRMDGLTLQKKKYAKNILSSPLFSSVDMKTLRMRRPP